ncbi:MAG: AI-2E family transporter [Spirochaetales bacterium]
MPDQPRVRVVEVFFLLLLVALTVGFYMVMRPFLINIFLAAVFTSVLFPTFEKLKTRFDGRGGLAALVLLALVFVGIAVPAIIIGTLVYTEAVNGYRALVERLPELVSQFESMEFLQGLEGVPFLGDYVATLEQVDFGDEIRTALGSVSGLLLSITRRGLLTLGSILINFALILLLMFFFFVNGRRLMDYVFTVVPMPNAELAQISEETRKVTAATIISTIIIGLIEGTLGVVVFSIFGISSPFLWGLIIVVVSMIPLIGTNLVIVPAGISLLLGGRVLAGILVILAGVSGVATTQNVIKPKLLGDRTGLHPALALLSTIGGIAWLGIVGFLVGPLLATLCIVIWQQFGNRYREELSTRSAPTTAPAPDEPTGPSDPQATPEARE